MAWHGKPSGAIGYATDDGRDNLLEIANFFSEKMYTVECQSGIIGNIIGESGLNPWRWQGDTVNRSGGYGLFQYTPASGYLDNCSGFANYAPNLSVTQQTAGAEPTDGLAQLEVFHTNYLSKWGSSCWRPYWSTTTYADLWEQRNRIIATYGSGNGISMVEFRNINNVWDATFVFLACFEGPLVPNMDVRYKYASAAYEIITGHSPDPPTPIKKKMPLWLMLKPF